MKSKTGPPASHTEPEPWHDLVTNRVAALANAAKRSHAADEARDHRLFAPRPRSSGLLTFPWMAFDYLRGACVFQRVGPCVTVFGSARIRPEDPAYQLAQQMGGAIAKLGFTVMTGGGPGIMEAANRGASEVGGRSVGCNIKLASEQGPNPYLDRCVTLRFFSVRKMLLRNYSYAFVVFPGGAGTLDEMFEAVTLIQTGKMEPFPLVLMGADYWRVMISSIQKMARLGTIGPRDPGLIHVTDSIQDALAYLLRHAIEPLGLRLGLVRQNTQHRSAARGGVGASRRGAWRVGIDREAPTLHEPSEGLAHWRRNRFRTV